VGFPVLGSIGNPVFLSHSSLPVSMNGGALPLLPAAGLVSMPVNFVAQSR
jgi:hypothetical protein